MTNKKEDIEVDEFLKKSPVLPCFLLSREEGRVETVFDGFEKMNVPIQKIKENSTKIVSQESTLDSTIVIDKKYIYDLFFAIFNLNFNSKKNKNATNFEERKCYFIEHKLYSFNVREEDLSFSQYYIDKFQKIANSDLLATEKAHELENIFSKTGYYIPKKIYVGGMLKFRRNKLKNCDKITSSKTVKVKRIHQVNAVPLTEEENEISSENFDFKEIFESEKTEKIGGDKACKTYEEWYKSINLSNASVIECTNIITAGDILDNDLKEKLREPLRMIEDKYSRKKKYLEYLETIFKINNKNDETGEKLAGKKDYGNFSKGICKENKKSSEPFVYKERFKIDTHVSYIYPVYREKFHQRFKDVIVGFEIIDIRKDGYNGQWTIKNEPLGDKEIKMEFASCVMRGQDFFIDVYLMKFPGL